MSHRDPPLKRLRQQGAPASLTSANDTDSTIEPSIVSDPTTDETLPMTHADMARIPQITETADIITYQGKDHQGLSVIRYEKKQRAANFVLRRRNGPTEEREAGGHYSHPARRRAVSHGSSPLDSSSSFLSFSR